MRLPYAEVVLWAGSIGWLEYGLVCMGFVSSVWAFLYGHVCMGLVCMGLTVQACLPEVMIERHGERHEGKVSWGFGGIWWWGGGGNCLGGFVRCWVVLGGFKCGFFRRYCKSAAANVPMHVCTEQSEYSCRICTEQYHCTNSVCILVDITKANFIVVWRKVRRIV